MNLMQTIIYKFPWLIITNENKYYITNKSKSSKQKYNNDYKYKIGNTNNTAFLPRVVREGKGREGKGREGTNKQTNKQTDKQTR